MEIGSSTPLCPPNAALISYTLIRHIGLILDELSSQGLELWQDEHQRWRWRWLGAELQAEQGFWALGEAVVDAVVSRYPAAFDSTADVVSRSVSMERAHRPFLGGRSA